MFSFRRLRQIWNESVCVNRVEGRRLAYVAGAAASRTSRVAAKIALAAAPGLLFWGAAAAQAQDTNGNPPAQTERK